MSHTAWYHGGDLVKGKPKGPYLYVTDHLGLAEEHAREDSGKVYRLRPEHHRLVMDHPGGGGRKVIHQADINCLGGVLSIFEEVN